LGLCLPGSVRGMVRIGVSWVMFRVSNYSIKYHSMLGMLGEIDPIATSRVAESVEWPTALGIPRLNPGSGNFLT
jgi:hypothetical protein